MFISKKTALANPKRIADYTMSINNVPENYINTNVIQTQIVTAF